MGWEELPKDCRVSGHMWFGNQSRGPRNVGNNAASEPPSLAQQGSSCRETALTDDAGSGRPLQVESLQSASAEGSERACRCPLRSIPRQGAGRPPLSRRPTGPQRSDRWCWLLWGVKPRATVERHDDVVRASWDAPETTSSHDRCGIPLDFALEDGTVLNAPHVDVDRPATATERSDQVRGMRADDERPRFCNATGRLPSRAPVRPEGPSGLPGHSKPAWLGPHRPFQRALSLSPQLRPAEQLTHLLWPDYVLQPQLAGRHRSRNRAIQQSPCICGQSARIRS